MALTTPLQAAHQLDQLAGQFEHWRQSCSQAGAHIPEPLWAQTYARDPDLAHQWEVEILPALSTANVRELLKAVLPVPQLTPQQATELVITHLIHRARSTSSRLRCQVKPHDSS
jgi:hypothetical protein